MDKNADGIEARILADLRPVRPLAPPWRRGLGVAAIAGLAAAYVTARYGIRADAASLGPILLWGLSAAQALYGLALIASALRESIPGRGLSRGSAPLLIASGFALALLVTFATWSAHATQVPPGRTFSYWRVCFETPTLFGLPSLALVLLLAFRAYPTRPTLIGGLAGLGAGLLADGSWRTFCEVTAPSHVLSSHLASVLLLTCVGLVAATLVGRIKK
jgi:hypothetical protein